MVKPTESRSALSMSLTSLDEDVISALAILFLDRVPGILHSFHIAFLEIRSSAH